MAYPYVVCAGVLDGLSLCCSSTCVSRSQSTQASNLSRNAVGNLWVGRYLFALERGDALS